MKGGSGTATPFFLMNHVTPAHSPRRWGADILELLGSMRFAVSLLMFICVASLIGTVLQQNQVPTTYVDQFGPFWFAVLDKFSIWHVYNTWWFLLIMGFLVVSTTICVLRNAPKMVRDASSFREYVRGSSLRAFPHRVEGDASLSPKDSVQRLGAWLQANGYKFKQRVDGDSVMVAAKKGAANRLGYIFAHVAIVVICVGGLLDSELPVRLQVWLGGKQPITENMLISEVPETGRLSASNPSFRANMLLPEGSRSATGIVAVDDGVLTQPLPFIMELKKFVVEYYSTGMPSSFTSLVEVTDPDTGEKFERAIAVNEPLRYKGVTVYQSSFDDGGSRLELEAHPLQGSAVQTLPLAGKVGEATEVTVAGGPSVKVDLSGLRVINVENLDGGADLQPRPAMEHVASVAGSAAAASNENLRNVGPSVQYRLTGQDGQAFEYSNYMLPIELDGLPVFLAGVRRSEAEPYRYLRIPADANGSVNEFMRLRAGLSDPALRNRAAVLFAAKNSTSDEQRSLLEKAAQGALEAFWRGGFNGIVERVPEEERERVLAFAVPMIQLSMMELRDLQRERHGEPAIDYQGPDGQQAERWTQVAMLGLANLPDYPAPVFLTLKNFEQVEASVFQIARSPGKNIVYLGCLFLVIGVFSMFYIRDRRVWVWITPNGSGSRWQAAMTSQRRNLDFTQEFERFRDAFKRMTT